MNQPTNRIAPPAVTALFLAVSAMLAACGGGDAEAPPLGAAPPAPAVAPGQPPAPGPAPTPGPGPAPAPSVSGTLLVSFDEASPAITGVGAYGGALPSVEAGPAGGSGSALKILKPVDPVTFGGTFFNVAAIPFAANRKVLTARVNSTRAGAVIKFKVEIAGGANVEIASAPTGAANTWSTVSWDFSAVDLSRAYTVVAITPDADLVTSGQTYWIDDITLAPAGSAPPPAPAPAPSGSLLVNFDETNPAFTGMGAYGGGLPSVETAPTGGSGLALKILKPVDPVTFGGTFFNVAAIPFAANRKVITARVYATRAAAIVRLKVEIAGGASVEVAGTATGAANTWTTVTWDLAAVDPTRTYTVIAITPDADLVTTGQSYWIDDLTLAAAVAAPPPPALGATFVSFDETVPAFSAMGAYGGALPSVEVSPTGGSGNALKILKPVSPVTFGGAFFTTATIPFSSGNQAITARVYSTRAGAVIKFKVEVPGGTSVEVASAPTGAANTWSTLTWDFSAANLASTYRIIAITPDADLVTSGQAYWIDDIKVAASAAPAPAPAVTPVTLATLEEPGASAIGFLSSIQNAATVVAESAIVNENAACGSASANKIVRWVKPATNVANYAGYTIVTVANGGLPTIPFTSTAKTMTVRVWSPDSGIKVRLKVEDVADATKSVETEAVTSVAGGWQTLSFDFAAPAVDAPTPLNLANTYNKVSIFFDFGNLGTGKSYYFDDVTFVGATANTVLVNFEEVDPRFLSGFGGADDSTIVGQSLAQGNPNGKAARVVKNNAFTYAGTSIVAKPNDAIPQIPFAVGATKLTLRTCTSAPVGTRVRMKAEQSGKPEFNSEVDTFTTVQNAWETLTFDFGHLGQHLIPNGPGPTGYQSNPALPGYLPTAQLEIPDPNIAGRYSLAPGVFNKVNVFFDYGLGDGGYAGMPDQRIYYADLLRFIGP